MRLESFGMATFRHERTECQCADVPKKRLIADLETRGLIVVFPVNRISVNAVRELTMNAKVGRISWRIKSEYVSVTRCGSPHMHGVLLRSEGRGARH